MSKKYVLTALAAFCLAACGGSEKSYVSESGNAIITERPGKATMVSNDVNSDPMQVAIHEARGSIDHFFEMKDMKDANYSNFTIKAGLPTKDNSFEHIWVSNVKRQGGDFYGQLDNDPYNLSGDLKIGDTVSFKVDQITDWGYSDGLRQRGHFTTRLLINELPEEDRRMMVAILHDQPLP